MAFSFRRSELVRRWPGRCESVVTGLLDRSNPDATLGSVLRCAFGARRVGAALYFLASLWNERLREGGIVGFPLWTCLCAFMGGLWEWQATIQNNRKLYGKRTVEAYLHRPKFELYDLENDPDEVQNLAGNPKYENVLSDLKAKLKAFQKRTNDPWLLKWDYE